jgi:hypothetical protein
MLKPLSGKIYSWFTTPGSTVPLARFRILIAIFCMIKMLVVQREFLDIYGQYGLVQWAITRANLYPGLVHLGDIAIWLSRVGLSANQTVYLIEGIYFVALAGLGLGFATRWMAIIAWFINFLWMQAGGGLIYGMDIFTHIALFYCMIMPVGKALSLDAVIKKIPPGLSVAAGVTRKVLQIQMCIVYFSAGVEKALGIQWWNGDAIWRSLMLPVFHHYDVTWMARVPIVPMAIGWSTIVIELAYPIFVWIPKFRKTWIVLTIAMHLGIGIFLGMWLFAAIMTLLNIGAFWDDRAPQYQDR